MKNSHKVKTIIVGALLSGGIAMGGLAAGTAQAQPQSPDPSIDISDSGLPIVQCKQCQRGLPNPGNIHVNPAKVPGAVGIH